MGSERTSYTALEYDEPIEISSVGWIETTESAPEDPDGELFPRVPSTVTDFELSRRGFFFFEMVFRESD
ncbi:Hypothetical protein POVR1_LOCUS602 [uncultured virus]|nr:Hypothetical protein POVR1_LOCUS602 [uncultured virus]